MVMVHLNAGKKTSLEFARMMDECRARARAFNSNVLGPLESVSVENGEAQSKQGGGEIRIYRWEAAHHSGRFLEFIKRAMRLSEER